VSIADTWVEATQPTVNHGTETLMLVEFERRSYLKFDLSIIPPGSTISAASLTLCRTGSGSGTTHELRPAIADWTETGLTWSTQPALSTNATHTIPVPSSLCVTVSVQQDVQSWVLGAANFGWRIMDTDETNAPPIEWATRENASSGERPKLDVTYSPP
jgi:hypothetical protein